MAEVYVIWGQSPDPGTKPETYGFETEAEAVAFREGIAAAMGWMEATEVKYHHVRVRCDGTINPNLIKEVWND